MNDTPDSPGDELDLDDHRIAVMDRAWDLPPDALRRIATALASEFPAMVGRAIDKDEERYPIGRFDGDLTDDDGEAHAVDPGRTQRVVIVAVSSRVFAWAVGIVAVAVITGLVVGNRVLELLG